MKKILFFGLIAAALGFTACNGKNDPVLGDNTQTKGMVLKATVEQPAETRATIDASSADWHFAFAQGDEVRVNNTYNSDNYTFTNRGEDFVSEDARPTYKAATWFAYFPSRYRGEINLTNQPGSLAGVANLYALAGQTDEETTGEEGLSIAMSAKVAILKIHNYKGSIDIQVKTSARNYVTGLETTWDKNVAYFNVTTNTTGASLFTTNVQGFYYVVVPAGVQISIKDDETTIKSTTESGLTAGKYYELTIGTPTATKGIAKRTGDIEVTWVQLWENGPKFAEYNVGANSVIEFGGYYCWGGSIDKDIFGRHNEGTTALTGEDDTATKLWGSNWRMPTKEDFDHFSSKYHYCDVEWTIVNGVAGRKFTGRGDYASNSIFLPSAGYFLPNQGEVVAPGNGIFWSSEPESDSDPNPDPNYVYTLFFSNNSQSVSSDKHRDWGYSVRAVLNEQ